jgi:hypothetical protein
MVQGRLPGAVGRVEWAVVLNQEVEHRHRAHSGGSVDGVLAALVAHAGRCRRSVLLKELAGKIQVGLGRQEVKGGL